MIEESYLKYIEDLRQAEKEVMLRDWTFEVGVLTATVETQHTTIAMLKMVADKAEAREKALRAITGEMRQIERDPGLGKPPYLDALTEWDRRAATVT